LSAEETARPLALVSPTDAASGGADCSGGNTRHRADALESVSRPGGVPLDPHDVPLKQGVPWHSTERGSSQRRLIPLGSEVQNA
jgi:hypothetical protein